MRNFSIDSTAFSVSQDNNSSEPKTVGSVVFEYVTINYVYQYGRYLTSSLAVLTNILIVGTMIRCWTHWKHSTGLIILTLACIDLINNIVYTMRELHRYRHVTLDYVLFLVMDYLSLTLAGISNFMMTLISLNRYALVCKPFEHFRITSRKSTLMQMAAVTLMQLCLNMYAFMPLLTLSHGEFCKICAVIVYGLLSHIIPIVVSVVLTILVFREVYKGTELVDYFRTQQPCRGKRNITRAMIAVNVAFILLSLPHTIAYIALTVKKLYAHHGSFLTFHAIQRLLVILRDMNYNVLCKHIYLCSIHSCI